MTTAHPMLAGAGDPVQGDSLFRQTLATAQKEKVDSVRVEILSRKDITPKSDFMFLNKELSTTVFAKCTSYKAIRVFHDSCPDWLTSISFLEFPQKDLRTVSNLFSTRTNNSFSFKMYNRYFWYILGNRLVLIESYGYRDAIGDRIRKLFSADTTIIHRRANDPNQP